MSEATSDYGRIHECMQLLAAWCDGAHQRDGYGFNSSDTRFGHILAENPPTRWSPKMASIAYRIMRRYKRQLIEAAIDVDSIPEPAAQADGGNGRKPSRDSEERFTAELEDNVLRLRSARFPGYEAIAAVKAIPGQRSHKGDDGEWTRTIPLTSSVEILGAVNAGYIAIDGAIRAVLASRLEIQQDAVAASQRQDADIEVAGIGGTLLPYQRAGVAYAIKHMRTFIADEPGLGKTCQSLSAIQGLNAYPAIIVVPASLKINWYREAIKWLPTIRRIVVLEGGKMRRIPANTQIVIINYDILHAWLPPLMDLNPAALILDESHYCKGYKSRRTIAARYLATGRNPEKHKPSAKRQIKMDANGDPIRVRLCLTGTPVVNQPVELIPQLQILGRLNQLGGWKGFTKQYCIESAWGGFERGGRHLAELNARMRAGGFFIRRLKSDVLPDLPDKRRVRVPVAISNRRAYDEVLRRAAQAIKAQEPAAQLRTIGQLRGIVADGKIDAAVEFIQSMVDQGQKVIMFAHHRRIVERIAKEFKAPMIMGDTSMAGRQAAVDAFQTKDSCRVISLNLQAGGVGLTLTASSNVVFVESAWTPAGNLQAEDRAHRIGQKDSVTAWYLEGEGTIDEWLSNLIEKKRETVDAATEGEESSRQAIASQLAAMIASRA